MHDDHVCPKCGTPLSPDVPGGACPQCLLAIGLETQDPAGTDGTQQPPASMADIARAFPELEVIALLGRGGMGVVYKARQPALDRMVALKILPARVVEVPGFSERFTREARLLARLDHPGIVRIHEFGKRAAMFFLILEFVDGLNIRQLMAHERLSPPQALAIVPQICEALEYAHSQGVVHRDIKPENILVTQSGRVKIADFGLAKMNESARERGLTVSGDVMGTPHYMAPEQIERPTEVDHRADIYSLGVVFYEMLTGELPLGRFRPPSEKVTVDVRLDEVVLRALARERELRYQTVADVRTDVQRISVTAPAAAIASNMANAPANAANAAEPRLCRMAIAGSLGLPAAIIFYLVLLPIDSQRLINQVWGLAPVIVLVAWILSIVSWARIASSRGKLRGLGYAITGTILPVMLMPIMLVGLFFAGTVAQRTESELREKKDEFAASHLWNNFRDAVRESGMSPAVVERYFTNGSKPPEIIPSELLRLEVKHAVERGGALEIVVASDRYECELEAVIMEGRLRFSRDWEYREIPRAQDSEQKKR